MAKKEECVCPICKSEVCTMCSVISLVLGVIFLLKDLNIWDFWGINWWTVVFLLIGAGCLIGFRKE